MNKKSLLFLATIMLGSITGCDQPEATSSPEVLIDENLYEKTEFVSVSELFMLPGETYDLSKMANIDFGLKNVTYLSGDTDCLTIDNNGIMTAISRNNQEKYTIPVYIHDDSLLQKIDVHVVDYNVLGSAFLSTDIGRLYGKSVMFFGDSITHNWLKYPNGDDTINPSYTTGLGYPDHYIVRLNEICKFSNVVNAAWSGGTMAYLPSSRERFTWKSFPGAVDANIENIKNTDYFFVFYGTNDLTDQIRLGTIIDEMTTDGKTNSSFAGGMKYGIDKIRSIQPEAKIIFLNLAYRTYPVAGGIKIEDYNKIIKDACMYYNCKHIDVFSMYDPKLASVYLSDGLHFTSEGYALLTDYILNNGKRKG